MRVLGPLTTWTMRFCSTSASGTTSCCDHTTADEALRTCCDPDPLPDAAELGLVRCLRAAHAGMARSAAAAAFSSAISTARRGRTPSLRVGCWLTILQRTECPACGRPAGRQPAACLKGTATTTEGRAPFHSYSSSSRQQRRHGGVHRCRHRGRRSCWSRGGARPRQGRRVLAALPRRYELACA